MKQREGRKPAVTPVYTEKGLYCRANEMEEVTEGATRMNGTIISKVKKKQSQQNRSGFKFNDHSGGAPALFARAQSQRSLLINTEHYCFFPSRYHS